MAYDDDVWPELTFLCPFGFFFCSPQNQYKEHIREIKHSKASAWMAWTSIGNTICDFFFLAL